MYFQYNLIFWQWFLYSLVFVLALSLGSFLNSWIWRREENMNVINDRSICRNCHRKLRWYENIPILSFILLKGKCRTCKRAIGWRYPLVEITMAVSITVLALHYNYYIGHIHQWMLLRDIFFATILVVIAAYDILYGIIPARLVWVGAIGGAAANLIKFDYSSGSLLIAALIGGGFFFLQYILSKGKWIGGGDVRLGIMMGLWLGWPQILLALFIAYLVGAIVSVLLLIFKNKQMASAIPFGPFLVLGAYAAMVWGEELLNWYFSFI